MNTIHRHIFANVVMTCAASVGLFGFILMLGNALKNILPLVLAGQLAPDTFFRLMILLVPFVVSYALPMGMLTGILLVLGRMSSDREITALRASGMSVAWLSAPVLFVALLGVALAALINFQYMPVTRLAYQRLRVDAVRENPLNYIVPKTFIRDFPGVVIYAGERKESQLKDLWLWELDAHNRVKRFSRADGGHLEFDEANNKMVLTAEHAQLEWRNVRDPENFSAGNGAPSMDRATFDLSLSKITGESLVQKKLRWFTFSQLLAEWRRWKGADATVPAVERIQKQMRVQITLHEKFSVAFSVLSFALVAIPLGMKVSRKETSANLIIGVALALMHYFATFAVGSLDNHAALRPDLLMWLPNIAFQSLGLWMFYRVDRT